MGLSTLFAAKFPNEDVIRVAKAGNGSFGIEQPQQLVLIEGMKALFADLSAAGLGAAGDWFKEDGPVDLQNLRIDRSYGELHTEEGKFLEAVRDGQEGSSTQNISKPDLWESAVTKAALGVDESKMSTMGSQSSHSYGGTGGGTGKPGKPGKPGGGYHPHHPPGPGSEIPEPSTWALLLSGSGALTLAKYRRRR